MKYKIIVDKQSRVNPSTEKKEYEVDIAELHTRGKIYDSLVITKDEDYVMRRLQKNEYNVLNVLEEPIKEPLPSLNIELFEGDNYIYLIDMVGNKIYAEYLLKNDFTDRYVTKNEMNSAINQTAGQIELTVNQKLEEYSTTEEMQALLQILANQINLEIAKKINAEDVTAAKIMLMINEDNTSGITLDADKIGLTANDVLNIIAGTILNLSALNIKMTSNNFSVDEDGNVVISTSKEDNTGLGCSFRIKQDNNNYTEFYAGVIKTFSDGKEVCRIATGFPLIILSGGNGDETQIWDNVIRVKDGTSQTSIYSNQIITPKIQFKSNNNSEEIEGVTLSGNNLFFGPGGQYSGKTSAVRGNNVRLYAHDGGGVYLGASGSTAITSDENLKNISNIDEKYIEFFKNLKPVTYVYKDRGHRSHIGFGARQVEQALGQAGLTTEQFAGILKDTDVTISADEMGTEEDVHYDELYSLRYEEFIALNTMMIQNLTKEIKELKAKVAELEAKQ